MLRFAVGEAPEAEFVASGRDALEVLATRPGYQRGQLARAYDNPNVWCLVTEWASVGAYRRALSAYDVKLRATPLLARAVPEESAFEPLATAASGEPVQVLDSDRAPTAPQS